MSVFAVKDGNLVAAAWTWFKRLSGVDSSKIFILPTWYCLVFNFIILFLMFASFPLRNVPLFGLMVFLVFVQLLSMVESHVNLRELEFRANRDLLVEAGSQAAMVFQVSSQARSLGISLRLLDDSEITRAPTGTITNSSLRWFIFREFKKSFLFVSSSQDAENRSFIKIEREPQSIQMAFQASGRGAHRMPMLLVSSYFPLGLFRAIKIIDLSETYVAYPMPIVMPNRGDKLIKQVAAEVYEASKSQFADGSEEYAQHRTFRFGDSLRRVDWRASSRRGSTIVKVFDSPIGSKAQVLRWQDTRSSRVEGKLSELAYGVLQAAKNGQEFGLEIPQAKTKISHGERHRIDCLRLLALFQNLHDTEET